MTLTPGTLPPGWTPFAPGSYPTAGVFIATLHADGTTTPMVHCRAHNHLRLPPLFGSFDRPVVGWRLATGPFPRVPKEPVVKRGHSGW